MAERARKIRAVAATAAATVALAVPVAVARAQAASESAAPSTAIEEQSKAALQEPTPDHPAPGPIKEGEELVPPATNTPSSPPASGGVSAGSGDAGANVNGETGEAEEEGGDSEAEGAVHFPGPSSPLSTPREAPRRASTRR